MKYVLLIIMCVIYLLSTGCGGSSSTKAPAGSIEKPVLAVTLLPQKYFVEQIAGDKYDILVMIPPGHNAATYSPTTQQMQTLSKAKLYLKSGNILFESAWMDSLASNNKEMKIIDTSAGVDFIKGHDHKHEHGAPSDVDPKTGIDPHIWLSPKAVKIQAQNILDAIISIDNQNHQLYETNYNKFIEAIDALDSEIKTKLSECKSKKFMVFHPAWSYFCRDYGLEQISIEGEGKSPSPAALKEAIDLAKKENIRIIFIQSQFDSALAQSVANEINGKAVTLNPLAEDWMKGMKDLTQALYETLK